VAETIFRRTRGLETLEADSEWLAQAVARDDRAGFVSLEEAEGATPIESLGVVGCDGCSRTRRPVLHRPVARRGGRRPRNRAGLATPGSPHFVRVPPNRSRNRTRFPWIARNDPIIVGHE